MEPEPIWGRSPYGAGAHMGPEAVWGRRPDGAGGRMGPGQAEAGLHYEQPKAQGYGSSSFKALTGLLCYTKL